MSWLMDTHAGITIDGVLHLTGLYLLLTVEPGIILNSAPYL